MTFSDPQDAIARLNQFLQPWYESIRDPETNQKNVLGVILGHYDKTEYGRQHGANEVQTIEDFRKAFPVVSYEDIKPLDPYLNRKEIKAILKRRDILLAEIQEMVQERGDDKFYY